jgi:hypothetical protein
MGDSTPPPCGVADVGTTCISFIDEEVELEEVSEESVAWAL